MSVLLTSVTAAAAGRTSNEAGPASSQEMRVAFAVGGLMTEGSGVARIVCDLANAILRQGTPVDVYTANCPGRGLNRNLLDEGNRVHAPPGRWLGRLAWSGELKQLLAEDAGQFDVVHNHSLWMLPTSYAARAAHRKDVPVVFTVHGFLEPWALSHSRWKKRVAGWLFQDRDLREADCIHVNSRSELTSVRAYGLKNRAAIIPNGIDLRHFENMPEGEEFLREHPEFGGQRVCLFLSRLHEKKGLGHLAEAWARVSGEFPDWQLVIAGPNDGYEPVLREKMATLGVDDCVTITGPLYGSQKFAAYSAAEAFVLPSFSEGFSMAVLEGLAAGLPVLLTPGCNFPEASASGGAVEVEPNAEATAAGLRQLLSQSSDELSAMGQRGRQLVEASYTWDRVAQTLLELYAWLGGRGPQPDCVVEE